MRSVLVFALVLLLMPLDGYAADSGKADSKWVAVLTSEFVWGIIIGLLLAIVVAIITDWLTSRQRRRTVAAFCQDLIGSICELIQNLEDNRVRNRAIDHEFLETITAEILVYGRNREHLVALNDEKLRRDVRDFFTRTAALLANIKWQLGRFYEANQASKNEPDQTKKRQFEEIAAERLSDAHKNCDALRDIKTTNRDNLRNRLESFSKRFF